MQHDMVLENQAGAAFRADLNDVIAALVTNSSGPTAPSVTYAFMFWADTSAGQMKQRDSTNTDWILIGNLDEEGFGSLPAAGGTLTGDLILTGATLIEAEGSDIAATATTDIWGPGNTKHITGNTTISSFGTAPQAGAWMKVIFDGTPTLTHSANLNLNNGSSNIAIQAGDYALVYADTTTQFDVIVLRKNGKAIAGGNDASESEKGIVELATSAELRDGTDATKAITPYTLRDEALVAGTSVASTSGTSIDFTGIPSWVKRIHIMFNGVSVNATTTVMAQIGDAGGIEASGYAGSNSALSVGTTTIPLSTGFFAQASSGAGGTFSGTLTLTLIDSATNTWIATGVFGRSDADAVYVVGGSKSLSAALDRLRITTTGGTATFDAGSVNIIYE